MGPGGDPESHRTQRDMAEPAGTAGRHDQHQGVVGLTQQQPDRVLPDDHPGDLQAGVRGGQFRLHRPLPLASASPWVMPGMTSATPDACPVIGNADTRCSRAWRAAASCAAHRAAARSGVGAVEPDDDEIDRILRGLGHR